MAKILWKMSSETFQQYIAISDELIEAAGEGDHMRYKEAEDKFRSLPNFPLGIHPELDLVVPQIVDTTGNIISIGSVN